MKNIRTFTLLFLSLSIFLPQFAVKAETKLPESQRGSSERLVYAISKKELRRLHLRDKEFEESMLGALVARYDKQKPIPTLPRGNYVAVDVVENRLNYTEFAVDDLQFKWVNIGGYALMLYDSLGNTITNAKVSKLRYDKERELYIPKRLKENAVIEIEHSGVMHYISMVNAKWRARPGFFSRVWGGIKSIFQSSYEGPEYEGFVAFNKPLYKPGEKVMLKGYIAKGKNGKPYDKPVNLRLRGGGYRGVDTVLTKLEPYRDGMYSYEFELSEELKLLLDRNYYVNLELDDRNNNIVSDYFTYEDYELSALNFSLLSNKENSYPNDSLKFTAKVVDENGMGVYGGKVELVVRSGAILGKQKEGELLFLPDTIWSHTFDMGSVSELDFELPDSTFPANGNYSFGITANYISADNERKEETLYIQRWGERYRVDFSLKQGTLTVSELELGVSHQSWAEISFVDKKGREILSESTKLPYSTALPWMTSKVKVETKESSATYDILRNYVGGQVTMDFVRDEGEIELKVNNPGKIPFWYTVNRNKREIESGYATELDFREKANKGSGYSASINYVVGDALFGDTKELPYVRKNMTMEVETPTVVYPGQSTMVDITLKDRKGRPVKGADVTAYGNTAKFKRSSGAIIEPRAEIKRAKVSRYYSVFHLAKDDWAVNEKSLMSWERWSKEFGLDDVEYYKFLYPTPYYSYSAPTADGKTTISPYVVVDGDLQGVQMLWINQRMHYAKQAEQIENYLFEVASGVCDIALRTHNRYVTIKNVPLTKGHNHIISFDVKSGEATVLQPKDNPNIVMNSTLLAKSGAANLTMRELDELKYELITVNENFGETLLPNLYRRVNLPVYINSGGRYYYLKNTNQRYYSYYNYKHNYSFNDSQRGKLVGPFPYRGVMNGAMDIASLYVDGEHLTNFEIDGGGEYSLFKDYQKSRGWRELPFSEELSEYVMEPNLDKSLITVADIEQCSKDYVVDQMKGNSSRIILDGSKEGVGRGDYNLVLNVEPTYYQDTLRENRPTLIYITPTNEKADSVNSWLSYGSSSYFYMKQPEVTLHLIFSDSSSYSKPLKLQKGGTNYFRLNLPLEGDKLSNGSAIAKEAYALVESRVTKREFENPYIGGVPSIRTFAQAEYHPELAKDGLIKGVVVSEVGAPIAGVKLMLEESGLSVVTDVNGEFKMKLPHDGVLLVSMLGMDPESVKAEVGNQYYITLFEKGYLEDVAVVGYGKMTTRSLSGSVSGVQPEMQLQSVSMEDVSLSDNEDMGGSAKLKLTGSETGGKPLVMVDGLPYSGDMSDIATSDIATISVLKGESATALYGAAAANGVVIITTKEALKAKEENEEEEGEEPGRSLRRNFSDYAFWQPKLTTDSRGEVSFEVTYPDDITMWNAYFLGVGGRKELDRKELMIRSFKSLSAKLSVPRFMVRGDKMGAIGRVTNLFERELELERTIDYGYKRESDKIAVDKFYLDKITVDQTEGDSVSLAYTVKMNNGYFDGEERKVPIYEKGVLLSEGDFKVINDNEVHILTTDPKLGEVTLYAETSSLEPLLRDIERVLEGNYESNDVLASKLLALLSQKEIYSHLGKRFRGGKQIDKIISKLSDNRNNQQLWGWWKEAPVADWVTMHVLEALISAEKGGYNTSPITNGAMPYLQQRAKSLLSTIWQQRKDEEVVDRAKEELLDNLLVMVELGSTSESLQEYFLLMDKWEDNNTNTMLKLNLIYAKLGDSRLNMEQVLKSADTTILGSLYWEYSHPKRSKLLVLCYSPRETNISSTIWAYEILKSTKGYTKELELTRNYLFEERERGRWRNSYETAIILSAVVSDLVKESGGYSKNALIVNGERVEKFPYTTKLSADKTVVVQREGVTPLFITAHQERWEPTPERESGMGFELATCFVEGKDTVTNLKSGKPVVLKAKLVLSGDAEYVRVELPIPAGCSYGEKRTFLPIWGKETHREYFREKVVIFCNSLSKGEHTFEVELQPRFEGEYSLNPAKAELFYFPTFYGNNELKTVEQVEDNGK